MLLRSAFALVSLVIASGIARAEFRIGVTVEDPDSIQGARVLELKEGGAAQAILMLQVGDVIRFVRSDNNAFTWRIVNAASLARVLGRTDSKATVYYLRGGKIYTATAKKAIMTYTAVGETQEASAPADGDLKTPE